MTIRILFLCLMCFYLIRLFFCQPKSASALTPSPTLTPTTTPAPTSVPETQIYLSELLPKPSTGDEWIEIFNPNNFQVSLTGWQLWDELSSPSLIFSFTTEALPAQTYLIVTINRKLNDAEDGVSLKNPQGQIIDSTHYINSPPDLSWSRQSFSQTSFSWLFQAASPNLPNPVQLPTPTQTPTPAPTPLTTLAPASTLTPKPISPNPTFNLKTTTPPKQVIQPVQAAQALSSLTFQSSKPKPSTTQPQTPPSQQTPFTSATSSASQPAAISQKTKLIQSYDVIMIGWSLIILSCSTWLIFPPKPTNQNDSAHQLDPKLVSNSL